MTATNANLSKVFVGNLPFEADDQDLHEIFSQAGNVVAARIVTDRYTGRSKGFGFVDMATNADAQSAIDKFNGAEFNGRPITVSLAQPKKAEEAPRRSREQPVQNEHSSRSAPGRLTRTI
jgi:RNA recognition motif-containing protein